MHDPMVVAFEIRRPWPEVRRLHDDRPRGIRGAFWRLGNIELYWPALATVWHVEPGDADAFEICDRDSSWEWHVHHWRIQVHPWQHFRRWAFTRCAWCGGRSSRGDRVNTGAGWEPKRKPKRWWQSEVGLYHGDCLSIDQAHRTCICSLVDGGPWAEGSAIGRPWGKCGTCGGFRSGNKPRDDYEVHMRTTELLQTVPKGRRDPRVTAEVIRLWREHREAERSTQ